MGRNQIIKDILNCITKFSANNYKIISIVLIIGLTLFLRIHHLDYESLWMDEIRQTSYYGNSLTEIIDNAASQSQPPLDYWIGHYVHFISNGDFAVRLPAALFGTGSVFLLVMLISQISSWPVACAFGIIYAFLPFNIYYSQEARPYAIAVFLFLFNFWILNRFLSINRKKKLLPVLMLLFFSTTYLYSRSLSPLVVNVSLLLILIIWLFFIYLKADPKVTGEKSLLMLSCGSIFLALVIYLPALSPLLANSGRYVSDTSIGLSIDKTLSTIINLNLSPIWQAYVVQTEPITYPLLALVCLSPFLGWKRCLQGKNSVWVITSFLLPLACILNIIIFQSKSNMPFRPPYASYILPLACILGAVSIQGLWDQSVKFSLVHVTRIFVLILSALFIFQTFISMLDYKTMRRKSDWRGVTAFLSENYDNRQLLIFDSFSEYGVWEPTFYGFPRYYRGHSPIVSIGRIPFYAPKMATLSLTPILILFQWREYYLTSRSHYPILSVPSPGLASIDYKQICQDPGFNCTEFTGFSVIQLREKSNNLARDTYGIIQKLLLHSHEGSWNVELHLAAAALAHAIQLDQWHYHLMQAEGMVRGKHLQKVKDIAEHIRKINPPEK